MIENGGIIILSSGEMIIDRSKIIMPSFLNKTKLCGTCAFWKGSRKIKPDGQIIYHPYSKGVCDGGGFGYASMSAMATCDHWKLWSWMDSAKDSSPDAHEPHVSA
jgi:hypothetical protein